MGQEKRSNCCNAKIKPNDEGKDSCKKCGRLITDSDVHMVTTRATFRGTLQKKT